MSGCIKILFGATLAVFVLSVAVAEAKEPCASCDTGTHCQDCQNCQNGDCDDKGCKLCKPYDPGHCHHTWHGIPYWMVGDWHKEEDQIPGVKRWSREDYYLRGSYPIGQRQKCYKGKIWPVDPRPTGPKPHTIHRFHAAHYWPYPYNIWSQNSVRNLISMHEQKGWRDATTIYGYHFDEESNDLTKAGVLHLQWILENVPPQHRTLYLQTSLEEGVNDLRLAEVSQAAGRLLAGQTPPDVLFRTTTPSGRPAQEIDSIRRYELQSIPVPRIEYPGGGGQGYGSGQ